MPASALRTALILVLALGAAGTTLAQSGKAGKPRTLGGVRWHASVDKAVLSQASSSRKRPILWLRTLGDLGGGL